MQSGVALIGRTATDPDRKSFSYVAKQLGGPANASSQQEVDFLRTIDADRIESFLQDHAERNITPPLYFSFSADSKRVFLPQEYVAKGRAGAYANVISSGKQPNDVPISLCWQLYKYLTLVRLMSCSEMLNERLMWSSRPWMGAYHFAEIPLITGTYGDYRGVESLEQQLSKKMQDLWLVFAKDAQKGLSNSGWEPYSAGGSAIVFGREGRLTQQELVSKLDSGCP
ncbi:MAG: hypothetical protein Q9224_003715 [Gallowayella concinna]